MAKIELNKRVDYLIKILLDDPIIVEQTNNTPLSLENIMKHIFGYTKICLKIN